MRTFEEAKLVVMNKGYDYLDQKNREFDHDYITFFVMVQTLKDSLAQTIETNFSSVWETGQGIKFLDKFEKVLHVISCIIFMHIKLIVRNRLLLKYQSHEWT